MNFKDIHFICGVCKSREKYLLGIDKINRLIDCESVDEFVKQCGEYSFGKNSQSQDVLSMIKAEEGDYISFVKEYATSYNSLYYLLLSYDFLNASGLYKSKITNMSEEKLLTYEGVLKTEELKKALLGEKCQIKEINDAFIECDKLCESKKPCGSEIDTIFNKYLYTALFRLVKNRKLKDNLKLLVDLKNISIILRVNSEEEYLLLKLPFGSLTKKQEEILLSKDSGKILEAFKMTRLYPFVERVIKEIGNPLCEYENLVDSYQLKDLKDRRFDLFGEEYFILYSLYRVNDIKNVRIAYVVVANKLDKAKNRLRLRECYNGK